MNRKKYLSIVFNRQKINTFLQYVLVFLIVLESRSVYSRLLNSSSNRIIIAGIILSVLLIILFNLKLKIKRQNVFFLIFYYIFMSIFLLSDMGDYKINFVVIFLILLPLFFIMFCLYRVTDIVNISKIYVDIIFTISIVSLFFYVIGSLLKIIPTNVHILMDWGGIKEVAGYSYLHFNAQTTVLFNETILRNTSIFVEGPMFALHLMFAMVLSSNKNKNILNRYSVIFCITTFSTLSITGILYCLFLLSYRYIVFNKTRIKFILLPVVSMFVLIISTTLFMEKQTTRSYDIRNNDYNAGLQVFKKYPIFGSGFLNYDIVKKYMSDFRMYNTGLSSSFIIILTQGGIYLTIFYLIPMVGNCIKLYTNKKTNMTLFQVMLLQLCLMFSSTYQYSSLMMILLAFDYYIFISHKKVFEIINLKRNEIV